MINRAYETAREAHRHQSRGSGESYINHPLAVARIVADIGLDEISLAAALLHDAVEDTEITIADVEAAFGSEVAAIVDGVTKLERLQFDSKEAQQAATMRKMLVAMARDLRVLIIKLADRLHNMRTIAAMPSVAPIRSVTRAPPSPAIVPMPAMRPKFNRAVCGSNRSVAMSQKPDPSIGPSPEIWR